MQRLETDVRGIPHLAKNQRDVGHPSFCGRSGLYSLLLVRQSQVQIRCWCSSQHKSGNKELILEMRPKKIMSPAIRDHPYGYQKVRRSESWIPRGPPSL